jgi:hypothetical protein
MNIAYLFVMEHGGETIHEPQDAYGHFSVPFLLALLTKQPAEQAPPLLPQLK